MDYRSFVEHRSETHPEASFTLWKASFGKRLELLQGVHSLIGKLECFSASPDVQSRYEAAVLEKEIAKIYLQCCLAGVSGLTIDGEPATMALLVERGPENLVQEIVARIQAEMVLSEEQRKN